MCENCGKMKHIEIKGDLFFMIKILKGNKHHHRK